VVYYATDQCRKRPEECTNAERGHSEHLLWHCLPDIPVAIHHNWFFSEPPMLEKNATNLQSDEKVLQFTIKCGDVFRRGGQVDYSLLSSEITQIIRSMCE